MRIKSANLSKWIVLRGASSQTGLDTVGWRKSMSYSRESSNRAVINRSLLSTMLIRCSRMTLGLALAALCLGPVQAQNLPGWTLVWSDEFDQPAGSAPNPAKWAYDTGASGWGNNEKQHYTSRTNNARIENGMLVIEAIQENYQGANYTSARLKTQGKAAWTYGRIEARIKIPRGQGIWPAFWMLGTNITSVGWPKCGEIDILENIGREPKIVHGTVHGPGYSGAKGIGGPYSLPGNPEFANEFHVYAVEWSTNEIKWFVNGVPFFTLTPASLPSGAAWVFTAPQFLILNVAVGGNWPGYPDSTTQFPQRMTVDYVRVYAATNAAPNSSVKPSPCWLAPERF
jgi:beta-glucanase (GH16 family)